MEIGRFLAKIKGIHCGGSSSYYFKATIQEKLLQNTTNILYILKGPLLFYDLNFALISKYFLWSTYGNPKTCLKPYNVESPVKIVSSCAYLFPTCHYGSNDMLHYVLCSISGLLSQEKKKIVTSIC